MTASHPQWDLEKLSGIFREAGKIALDYFETPPSELKSDSTVVTAADKAIENLLAGYFDKPAENSYMIGEETIATHSEEYIQTALNADCCWVLDPIDGTAPYSIHLPFWGISLGLLQRGRLVEGAVYLPIEDTLLITAADKLYCRNLQNDSDFRIFQPKISPLGLSGHIGMGQYITHYWRYTGSNQVFSWSSCVGSFYWLLAGKLSAYCGNFKLWDIAGLLPIMRQAGFPVMSVKTPHQIVTDYPVAETFELDAASDHRWRIKEPIITAPDKTTALTILSKFRAN